MAEYAQAPVSELGKWQVKRMEAYLKLCFPRYSGEGFRTAAVVLWNMAREVPGPQEQG